MELRSNSEATTDTSGILGEMVTTTDVIENEDGLYDKMSTSKAVHCEDKCAIVSRNEFKNDIKFDPIKKVKDDVPLSTANFDVNHVALDIRYVTPDVQTVHPDVYANYFFYSSPVCSSSSAALSVLFCFLSFESYSC